FQQIRQLGILAAMRRASLRVYLQSNSDGSGKIIIGGGPLILRPLQQLRQLGEVGAEPPRAFQSDASLCVDWLDLRKKFAANFDLGSIANASCRVPALTSGGSLQP